MTVIIAHRGSAGTHPENTLPAFMEAVRTGADGIELDVHLTADQQLVVIHDESVDRTTDGKGLIRELTLEEIKELDAGSWFDEKYQATKI
ncbi:MAG: glycerophosphodiester phosphodiesterase family protein, partial [Enterococcus hulanensis]